MTGCLECYNSTNCSKCDTTTLLASSGSGTTTFNCLSNCMLDSNYPQVFGNTTSRIC